MAKSRFLSVVFIGAMAFALAAFVFGILVIFAKKLPEGVLICGLGFCIAGTAGLSVTLGDDEEERPAKKGRSRSKKASAASGWNITLCPVGADPVDCVLSFGDTSFEANNGNETLSLPYDEIKELRMETPVLYIDWKDGDTWQMQFERVSAPMAVLTEFKKRSSVFVR